MLKKLMQGYIVNTSMVEEATWMVEDRSSNPIESGSSSLFSRNGDKGIIDWIYEQGSIMINEKERKLIYWFL